MVAAAWYAGWHASDFTLDDVSWEKYTLMTYAFAVTTDNPSILSFNGSNETLVEPFVKKAHENGVKASVSIGGWTGSLFYSSNVGSEQNRTQFIQAIEGLVNKYDLDAIDFDWEYPGRQGIGCNAISPNDTANFLTFLQELRKTEVGKKLTLTAAVSLNPFAGPDGTPVTDVTAFAKELDFIEIMNYDVWGSWSTGVGPDAPLNDSCAATANQQGSAVSAIKAWTKAGMPPSQIVLAVPGYGHSFSVNNTAAFVNGSTTELAAYPGFNASNQPFGDKWDDGPTTDECGNPQLQGGIFDFWGLVDGGFLNENGTVADGIASRFDNCSQTPYVYNPKTEVMVSYDNAESFKAKGNFIMQNQLRGFSMWEAGGDFDDILLDSIREAAGFDDCDD
ncbi:glycoside hydrolase [Schizopora paradoxa]|uniref:Glycoside hydrolase n=1 Tax=Schizopora paradoxa TaxID=27342 RepID=A0A0H2S3T8_9AGAM|nr:glycoside hydrolase [Schizopora paradoxa]